MQPDPSHHYSPKLIGELELILKENSKHNKYAIVFDIDQTAFLYTITVCHKKTGVCERRSFKQPQRNEQVYDIYQFAIANGIAVFFVTARTTGGTEITHRDLIRLGFGQMDGLFLRPLEQRYQGKAGVALYKSNVRRWISDRGYHILLNMGDKWQDLNGGYAHKHVKLPDTPRFLSSPSSGMDSSRSSSESMFQ
jgi:predicted secreted acid phosphatase